MKSKPPENTIPVLKNEDMPGFQKISPGRSGKPMQLHNKRGAFAVNLFFKTFLL